MDLPKSAEIFSELAMKGHPYAQFALGGMYYAGIGVEQNFTRAYSLYKVWQADPDFEGTLSLSVCNAGGLSELCRGGFQCAR